MTNGPSAAAQPTGEADITIVIVYFAADTPTATITTTIDGPDLAGITDLFAASTISAAASI